jgi:hypothetical protein
MFLSVCCVFLGYKGRESAWIGHSCIYGDSQQRIRCILEIQEAR